MRLFYLTLFVVGICYTIQAQNTVFSYELFINKQDTLQYRMLLPKNFSKDRLYPVVLFLHGAGERGTDNQLQLLHGSQLFLNQMYRDAFPAIVIFPQCKKNSYWSNAVVNTTVKPMGLDFPLEAPPTKPLSLVMQLMDHVISNPFVNKDKVYVGGLSMGGMGTFEILYRKPDMFAAAFSICGGGNPEGVKAYAKKTELWVFHGAKDSVVSPLLSVNMVDAYLKAGGNPHFSLYANDDHNSWDSAFAEPQLLTWLFSKSKN